MKDKPFLKTATIVLIHIVLLGLGVGHVFSLHGSRVKLIKLPHTAVPGMIQ